MGVTKRAVAGYILAALLIFGGGFMAAKTTTNTLNSTTGSKNKDYPLLAGRIFADNPSSIQINFSPLRTSLNKYFQDNALEGSVYFEYLPTGTAVRVNSEAQYRAASLIKLPVAMETYKAQELKKITLDKKVALKQEWLNDGYGTLYQKGAGYELTLREALKIMLKDSDNTALRVLIDANKGLPLENRALGSLDIEFDATSDGSIDIGTRSYASFLKCLYFACYNTQKDSQELLTLLANTPFNNRLVAGVNNNSVPIAHKIGVFNTRVQSDCGIVYAPNKHYVLCVMIEGDDDNVTNGRIAEISKMVYTFVKK